MKRAIILSVILTIAVIILGSSCTQNYDNDSMMNSNSMNGNMMNSNSTNHNTMMNSSSMNGMMVNQNSMMNNSNASRSMGLNLSSETAK